MKLFILCLAAYFFGSIPFGVIIGLWRGTDLRKEGSGNIGAANAVRSMGLGSGVLVLAGDMFKSILPLLIAKGVLGPHASPIHFVAVGFCAILGHNLSCFLKLRGGKGVASTFGVFLFLSWKAALAAFVVWVIVVAVTRFASLGSLAATLLLAPLMLLFHAPSPYIFFALGAFALIVYKHRANIGRLFRGEENPLSFGSAKKERL